MGRELGNYPHIYLYYILYYMKRRTQSLLLKYLIQILFYLLGIGMGLSIIYYGIKEYATQQNKDFDTSLELTSIKEDSISPQNNDIIGG